VPLVVSSLRGEPNFWSDATICENIFPKYKQDQLRSTKWDPDSIMQYFYPSDWVENGVGSTVKQHLSQTDKDFMKATYPPKGPLLKEDVQIINVTEKKGKIKRDPLRLELILIVACLAVAIIVSLVILARFIHRCKLHFKQIGLKNKLIFF
jgi:hypothetical protein